MRQKLKKHKWYHYSLFFLLTTILVFACRKIDNWQSISANKTDKFFTLSPTVNRTVQRVANELKRQNALTGFISDFASKQGYPVWDKAIMTKSNKSKKRISARTSSANEMSDTLVLIPLVLENTDYVNSFIAAKVSDDVLVKLYEGDKYDDEPFDAVTPTDSVTAEKYALQLMLFDNSIFGRTKFKLIDDRLFHDVAPMQADSRFRILEIKNRTITNQYSRMVTEIVSICIQVNRCPYQRPTPHCTGGPNGECDNCPETCAPYSCLDFEITTWYDDDWGGGGGDSGGGDLGGGGGDGGINPTDPCRGNGTIISGGRLACSGGGGGSLGWEPADDENGIPTTSCFFKQIRALKMGELYHIVNTDSILASIPNFTNEKNEKGFTILKRFTVNQWGQDTTFVKDSTTQIFTGDSTGIDYLFNYNSSKYVIVAALHTHPPNGYTAPSPADVYQLIKNRREEYHYQGSYIAASNGSQYALTIDDINMATAFYNTMSQYLNDSTKKWKVESAIGKAYDEAYNHFLGEDTSKAKKDYANEMAMAAVLTQYNVGITLNKKNAQGNFVPLVVNTTIPIPRKPSKKVYTQDCL